MQLNIPNYLESILLYCVLEYDPFNIYLSTYINHTGALAHQRYR